MDEWAKLFRDFGFPAGIAVFVLWRLDKTLHEVLRELVRLRYAMYETIGRRPPE